MDENNELQNSPNTDELAELDSLLGDEQAPAEPQIDWERRAKSSEKFLKDLKDATGSNSVKEIKEKLASSKPAPEPSKKEPLSEEPTISVVDMLELRKQQFTDEEILEVHNQAISLGLPIKKLLSNDIFKEGLERKREKNKVQQATPHPSQRVAPVFEGKKSFEDLSPAERQANWQTAISKIKGKGSNE